MHMTLTPAYGRDYKSQREVKNAFESGKDFEIASVGPDLGRYTSIRDFQRGDRVTLRYKANREVCLYTVTRELVDVTPDPSTLVEVLRHVR